VTSVGVSIFRSFGRCAWVLACVLTALQSSDAPQALNETFDIARREVENNRDPVAALRASAIKVLNEGAGDLARAFTALESEFSNDGIFARAIRRTIGAARRGFELRRNDPFFEFESIKKFGDHSGSLKDLIVQIPSCAVLQIRPGAANAIGRDILKRNKRRLTRVRSFIIAHSGLVKKEGPLEGKSGGIYLTPTLLV
jgi:hypothetical protein